MSPGGEGRRDKTQHRSEDRLEAKKTKAKVVGGGGLFVTKKSRLPRQSVCVQNPTHTEDTRRRYELMIEAAERERRESGELFSLLESEPGSTRRLLQLGESKASAKPQWW